MLHLFRRGDHESGRTNQTTSLVVVEAEEQYSIWPADRVLPLSWNDVGKQGSKAECLAYFEEVWADMQPLSLREQMEADDRKD